MVKLGEIFKLSSGKSLPEKNRINGDYNVYGGNGITGNHNDYFVDKSTIVIGRVGEYCGAVHLTTDKCWVTDNALMVTNWFKDVDKQYMVYLLNAKDLHQYAKTVGQPSISQGNVYGIEVEMPSLETQRKIASNLDKVTHTIDLCNAILEKLDLLVKSRFVEMFGDPVHNSRNLPLMPMTNVCEIIDGDRGKNYPKQEDFFDDEYCLFLNAKNVTKNGFDFSDCMFITKEKDLALRKGKLKRGDVVLTTRGTIGNLAFYTKDIPFENVRINSGMVILRMKREIVDEVFFIEQFRMQLDDIKRSIASGSAQPQLPISTMNKIGIIIPDIKLQKSFAAFVEQTDKSKSAVKQVLEKAETLKKALMQEYFG